MSKHAWILVVLAVAVSDLACASPQWGEPYAYGIQVQDDFLEERALACVKGCRSLKGDERLVCVSQCPGFVVADVRSCGDVPDWKDCAMAIAPPDPPSAEERRLQHDREERIGSAVLAGLFSLGRAVIEAAGEDEEEREVACTDDSRVRRDAAEVRRRKHERRGPLRRIRRRHSERSEQP